MSETIAYRGESTKSFESMSLEDLKLELDEARTNWARISAKRHNRLFDRRIRGYNQAKEQYDALVVEYGQLRLAEDLARAKEAQERNAIAISYIVDMQNKLREETNAISDTSRARKIGRAIGKWFTTGSKVTQFVKSAAVSTAAGIAGGVFGASVAALAAVRFAKGYVTSEVSGLEKIDARMYADDFMSDSDGDTLIERAQQKSAETFERAGGDQQAKKLAAYRRGVGMMAVGFVVGGTVGSLIHSAIDMPMAHATPLEESSYQNPGIQTYEYESLPLESHEYTHVGLEDTSYQSLGLETDHGAGFEATNPGLEEAAHNYTNPGLGTQSYENPGLESTHYENPGLVTSADADDGHQVIGIGGMVYENPGLETTHYENPGLESTQYENPGLETETVDTPDDADNPTNPDNSHNPDNSDPDNDSNPDTLPEPVETSDIDVDGTFTVEHGHGYVHEIMDAARANDIEITSHQAWEIHTEIVDEEGTDYINLVDHSGYDTYSMGDSEYETGISAPGEAEWDSDATNLLQEKLAEIAQHDDGEFAVNDFGEIYDVDAQDYYEALKGVDQAHWQDLLNEAAPELQSVTYGGESLTYHTDDGWYYREVDQLPPEASKILADVATQHNWTLAA